MKVSAALLLLCASNALSEELRTASVGGPDLEVKTAFAGGPDSEISGDDQVLESALDVGKELVEKFEEWIEKFGKKYHSAEEKVKRMTVWLENHMFIEKHNSQFPAPSFETGHNEYSDMTPDEFQQMFSLGKYSPGVPEGRKPKSDVPIKFDDVADVTGMRDGKRVLTEDVEKRLPKVIDWIEKGAVTVVKNQGHCGSCWAFSAVGAIEGLMAVHNAPLTNLSVQELVDCDKSDMGCMGGLMDKAFLYDEGLPGLCSWEEYPYDSPHADFKYECRNTDCDPVEGSKITGFKDVGHTDKDLMMALSRQPVSVAIQASDLAFQFYKKGVFDSDCGTHLDHGVLAVGWGVEDDEKYYKVKNSWGETWGEDGYIKMARGKDDDGKGQCGILMMPSYPTHTGDLNVVVE